MTRIETALERAHREAHYAGDLSHLAKALATPTGQALAALVEAAEAWREGYYHHNETPHDERFVAAVDAFRAATEPQS